MLSLEKQINFAAARALTETAKQSQDASIKAIQATFTTRGKWYLPSNRYGVKVRAARKENLEATVGTAADWLSLHETAGTKTPRNNYLAVATSNVRRTKRDIIVKSNRPRNLKRSFVMTTKRGIHVLFQRFGRARGDIRAMYILIPRARIKKDSTVVAITEKVVMRRFASLYDKALREALASAKPGAGGTP